MKTVGSGRRSRLAIVLFGCTIAWVMGVRAPRAATFEHVAFAGKGRATLVIDEIGERGDEPDPGSAGDGDEGRFGLIEVFAKLTFGTEISVFSRGLYVRSTFTLPRTGEGAVLVVDVDRARGATRWEAGDPGMRARLYTMPAAGGTRFDGEPLSGSLELEAAIVGRREAGFRIRGWLEIVDAGADGLVDTVDDTTLEVDVTLESLPTPEEIDGQPAPPPRQPQGGFCEAPWCWADDGYYDGYSYGYGCGDAEVGYDTTSDGCEGDTIDDGDRVVPVVPDDGGATGGPGVGDLPPSEVTGDDGCSGESSDPGGVGEGTVEDDPGCEGSDDGGSGDGCDGGESESSGGCDDAGDSGGCSDSGGGGCADSGGGASGCGSSGCSGDTLQRESDERAQPSGVRSQQSAVELVGLALFIAALGTWISDRRARRRR